MIFSHRRLSENFIRGQGQIFFRSKPKIQDYLEQQKDFQKI